MVRVFLVLGRNVVLDGALDGGLVAAGGDAGPPTRKIWVSTACAGWWNHMFRTTLAVFRPTPGSRIKAARDEGTWPP